METMKLTEKKKSSKGVVIGLLLFFVIGGAILFVALKMEDEPITVGANIDDEQTQNLVKVEENDKDEELKKTAEITYNVEENEIIDKSNKKMKANIKIPVISVDNEKLDNINNEINKYYTEMYNGLKEKMSSASSNYTYKVTYNVYDNIVEDKRIISVTIYERIVDDGAAKNTMNKIKTYNIDVSTKEQIIQSSDIAQSIFGKEYKTIIRDAIKEYVVSNKMVSESDFTYTYTGLKPFYIKENKFHLIFNEGDIVDSKYGVLDIIVEK